VYFFPQTLRTAQAKPLNKLRLSRLHREPISFELSRV
jgi:hypothetical protein